MKYTLTSALAVVLCTTVSSLALAASGSNGAALITPPPLAFPKRTYVPSVPERKTEAQLEAEKAAAEKEATSSDVVKNTKADASEEIAPAPMMTSKPRYVPSVPERKTEAQLEAEKAAAEKAAMDASDAAAKTEEPKNNNAELATPAEEAPAPDHMIAIKKEPVVPPKVEAPHPMATLPKSAVPSAAVGLSAALAKAYNFNPELQSYRSRLKAVDEQLPQAYAGWLPTARADYSYGYDKQKASNRALNGTHPETKSVSVVQPVFNGGETLARTDRAYNAVTVGRAQLTDAEQRVLLDAVKAYMNVVRTGQILKLSTSNEQVLKEQLQATRDRFKLGETTRTDVAQSEARLARATSDKVKAAGDLDTAKAAYLRAIGDTPKSETMPLNLPPIPKSLEEALRVGLDKNPTLIAADVSRKIADDDVDISMANLLPDLSIHATKSQEDGLSSRSGGSFDDNTVTLNATIPIFQSGAEYSRVRQEKRTRQQRKEEYDQAHNETVENITSRWRDIETARASIVSNRANVASATVALNGVHQEADVGTRTTLDVLDAEQELFVAKVNLVTAESNQVIAVYSLLSAIGALTAQDLALNVDPYDPTTHADSVKYRVIGF